YLSDIYCLRANIGYDLSHVATHMGDYAQGELSKAMNQDFVTNGIVEAYEKYAKGATLIFTASVEHAIEIAKRIKGAEVVTAETKNRKEIIERFTRREIPCLVNCMIFTEGTDIPLVETVIIARPTKNSSLYTQMVGRGLRLSAGKDKLTLIDCVGVTGKADLCTAPTLIGMDMQAVPESLADKIEGDLFDLERKIDLCSDCPASWIKNVKLVDLWAKEQKYNTHGINLFKMPNGDMVCQLPHITYAIKGQNELGKTVFMGEVMPMQKALDRLYCVLRDEYADKKPLWDISVAKRSWGAKPASEAQMKMVCRRVKGMENKKLTKLEASQVLNRLLYKGCKNDNNKTNK
ncbi:MAG: helicase-related protein, partial [Oscillospiraceae bacterium]